MEFISTYQESAQSSAVIRESGRKTLEGIAASKVLNGPAVEGERIADHAEAAFARMDVILSEAGLTRNAVTAVHVFLHDVLRDVDGFNAVWRKYFSDHSPCRYCVGATLQSGMLVEMNFYAEFPEV